MLDCSYCNVITTCETIQVLREKGAAGFDSPTKLLRQEPRNRHGISGSHRLRLQFLAARTGGRKPCRFSQELPGLSTRSSRRPRLTAGASVVATPKHLEAIMATTSRRTRIAQPSANIISFDQARQRRAAQAQQPRELDPLDVLETALNIYIGALRGMVQDVRAKGRGA